MRLRRRGNGWTSAVTVLAPVALLAPVGACSGSGFTAQPITDGSVEGGDENVVLGGGTGGDGATDAVAERSADTGADASEAGPGACDPSADPQSERCFVSDAYAIFVAPYGRATNPGTAQAPVDTISTALNKALSAELHVILVCGGSYTDAVSIDSTLGALSIYGGFTCPGPVDGGPLEGGAADAGGGDPASAAPGWVWMGSGAPTTINSSSFTAALTIKGDANRLKIADLSFTAQAAVGQDSTGAGNSSVAGWITQSTNVSLLRVAFLARDGVSGQNGGAYTSNMFPGAPTTLAGHDSGFESASAALPNSGSSTTCKCPDGTTYSMGGQGSPNSSAVPGATGSSNPAATPASPFDGTGGTTGTIACTNGHSGVGGGAVAPAAGATTLGTMSSGLWEPAAGAQGARGNPGQGGGGGGTYDCSQGGCDTQTPGAGGACGGCGGAAGLQGTGGGSSFALAIYDSVVDIRTSRFASGSGGSGGSGSPGEGGQAGGAGGQPVGGSLVNGVCSGGNGGPGSGGGGGGGGAGGSSVGIAWTGTPGITLDGALVSADVPTAAYFSGGTVGSGGGKGTGGAAAPASTGFAAGNAGPDGTKGIDGVVYAVKQF